jgi:methylenetetrahydrofolate dehydrogenase (NADP+)/methenyltetrahydrofolate cyclohydrolase
VRVRGPGDRVTRAGGPGSPATVIMDGTALAARRLPVLRSRAERVAARRGRAPRLLIVAFAGAGGVAPHVARKVVACAEAGVEVSELVVRNGTSPDAARDAMHRLAHDEHAPVDGVFLQFPYPDASFAEPLEHAIPEAMDVDVMSAGRIRRFLDDPGSLPPVTVSAALELVDAHGVDVAGRRGIVVADPSPFATMFRLAFARRGAQMEPLLPPASPALGPALGGAQLVIVAAASPGLVKAGALARGAVAIDAGYFNRGGRGDIDVGGGVSHLAAIAAVPGSIGPMTVSCLIERTILLSESTG